MKKLFPVVLLLTSLMLYGCASAHTHVYTDEIVLPTCTESGYTAHRCDCGEEYRDSYTEPLGHDYVIYETKEADCMHEGYITYVCARCGDTYTETLNAQTHNLENTEYSIRKNGVRYTLIYTGVCKECGKTVTGNAAVFGYGLDTSCGGEYEISVMLKGGGIEVSLKNGLLSLNAVPNGYFRFKCWSDGVKEASRTVSVEEAVTLDAVFEYEYYNMPVMNIDTGGEEVLSLDYYVNCEVTLTNCEEKYKMELEEAGIRVRGNASANYGNADWIRENKVHYRLKFDSKSSVLGINDGAKCKSWVLLRGDSTFIKEPISFLMGQKLLGDDYFVSDYTYADVYFNYEYMGVYIICDQIQIDKHRIDIDEPNKDETYLETGYLLEIDNYYTKEPYYFTVDYDRVKLTDMYGVTRTAAQAGYSVKSDNLSAEQLAFIKKYVSNAYKIVYQAIWKSNYLKFDENYDIVSAPEFSSSEEAVGNVMNIESLVGMYILHELCVERDVGVGSFFMYVDFTDEKPLLTFCAPWDFSWAFGDDTGFKYDKFSVSAWQPEEFISYAGNRSSTWFITLYHADWFTDMVKAKWTEAVNEGMFDALFAEIDRISGEYEGEFIKNNNRWSSGDQKYSSGRIAAWLNKRINWLNSQWLD
ncbi:MAG: CotH kinase family protein [Eubacteriales bacterium]|nr:CotH kinase family protein [Eubacteriales bacterium]